MISARDELKHAVDTFSEKEAEWALVLLEPILKPHCPGCHEYDIDKLVFQPDGETVKCSGCGHTWKPEGPTEGERLAEVVDLLRKGEGPVIVHEMPREE